MNWVLFLPYNCTPYFVTKHSNISLNLAWKNFSYEKLFKIICVEIQVYQILGRVLLMGEFYVF